MKEVDRWVAKAEKDLAAARINFEVGLFDVASFLCQQAVEKALKAVHIKKFRKLKKIHDLVVLGREAGLPERYLGYYKELTGAYIYTRYPEVPETRNIEENSRGFLAWSEEVIEWTKKRLRE